MLHVNLYNNFLDNLNKRLAKKCMVYLSSSTDPYKWLHYTLIAC